MTKRFQVIRGGRDGDRGDARNASKLFSSYSVSNLTKGRSVFYDVRFNWYCLERDFPPYPFEEVIADYRSLDERQRMAMEREVNRLFTEEEILDLRDYLKERYGMGLYAEEATLPLNERGHFFEEGSSVIYDFLELSERDGYPLSFKVWGYYTLQQCLTSPSLESAVRFIRRSLERLGLVADYSQEDLESVAKALYDQDGLVVTERKEP